MVVSTRPSVMVRSTLTGTDRYELPQFSALDVEAAFERARAALPAWQATSVRQRSRVLLNGHDRLVARREAIVSEIRHETGKTPGQALEEVVGALAAARYNALTAPRALRQRRRRGGIPFVMGVRVQYPAKGVVGIIVPWNYPVALAAMDALPALVAGNAVVMKADNQAAGSVLALRDCFIDAGLDPALWTVLTGEAKVVGEAITDRADYVCFTGSTATGRGIAEKVGSRLIGASLELGGKNPLIVLADANVRQAARASVYACFSALGQLCVSTERIYVARSIFAEYVEALRTAIAETRIGARDDADFGTLASAHQLGRVAAHLADAEAKGATVIAGGRPRPDLAPYAFEPTVLTGVTESMSCFAEETFGCLAAVYPFDDESEAIDRANSGGYGLNAAVFTGSLNHGRRVAAQLQVGTVNLNEGYRASFGSLDAPMGGAKLSGLGRRNGPEGIVRFTEPRTIAWSTGLIALPTTAAGFDRLGPVLIFAMRALRALRVR